MDRVFSVEEISDHFWSPPISSDNTTNHHPPSANMNRSASEWAFQRFLQEAAASPTDPNDDLFFLHDNDNHHHDKPDRNDNAPVPKNDAVLTNAPPPPPPPKTTSVSSPVLVDSEDYQALLKSKLNLACAAVAMTRVINFPVPIFSS